MTTSRTKLVYYKGTWWRTVLLTDGRRAAQPLPKDGGPADRTATRYYRRSA